MMMRMISRNWSPNHRDKVSSDMYNIIRSFSWEHPNDPMTRTNLQWRFTEALQLLHQERRMNPVKRDYVLDQIDRLLRPKFFNKPGWRVIAVFRECVEAWCSRQIALGVDDLGQDRDNTVRDDYKHRDERGIESKGKTSDGQGDEATENRGNDEGLTRRDEGEATREEQQEEEEEEELKKMAQVFEDIRAEQAAKKKMKLINLIT
jgi:hypothetical protein